MKTELKKKLSRLEGFENPNIELEQYVTPPELAAELIHTAYMQGDIESREVLDLGTGTGILAIGAALASGKVTGIDSDADALEIARENASMLDVLESIDFREQDISEVEKGFDTVVMNPPFSVHSDTGFEFLGKAIEVSETCYFISRSSSREKIEHFISKSRHTVQGLKSRKIDLPPTYGFHTDESKKVGVDLVITRIENGS